MSLCHIEDRTQPSSFSGPWETHSQQGSVRQEHLKILWLMKLGENGHAVYILITVILAVLCGPNIQVGSIR